ncbi:orotate phosphoribosyltransferase [Levilactobacillus bambusae]|uniref:Orotate phosphoribosyltransferase n=1 Tax=Levilactobacillus bambusae TaxID=2024736 RepID=A0A2V1MXY2_9LACO|nr:orotate phosphoribosyltransferase [Levilactobacillus bambusae]PWF99691.1 orotate phosphoribosyltransferase [Levilactobacillus bambusae]
MTLAQQLAKRLLQIQAVSLRPNQPFTWASGIKSPIYTDNRLTISDVETRHLIYEGFIHLIQTQYPETNVIAGVATAGIPHAAWVANELELPMVYVRSKKKDHGTGKQIEGRLPEAAHVFVIDDLISTGGSVLGVVRALKVAQATVTTVASIFSYELPVADDQFVREQVSFQSLTTLTDLLKVAGDQELISQTESDMIKQWRFNIN